MILSRVLIKQHISPNPNPLHRPLILTYRFGFEREAHFKLGFNLNMVKVLSGLWHLIHK